MLLYDMPLLVFIDFGFDSGNLSNDATKLYSTLTCINDKSLKFAVMIIKILKGEHEECMQGCRYFIYTLSTSNTKLYGILIYFNSMLTFIIT